ncbi:MAG: LexA family transcriptional regulator [Bacteroidales bacterium]|jgi:transcriptional regulator with XRE-family HTH domain|nr:LexA family transcriptional regulator [Bacteroidales bacterium]MBS3776149.1 LexA family transcriptional regulator [Bacteroidales bacterium]
MNFSKNIRLLRKRKKRTQDDVARALNIKRSTLSGYENEVAQPGIEALIAFSEYFNVAVDTLIKVDLSGLTEKQLTQLEKGYDVYLKGSSLRVLATTVDQDNNENIELVNERAKAGYQRGFADPEFIRKLPTFQLPFLPKEKKFRTFQISGESMLPIPDGSWVTGEFIQDWLSINNGEACIILTLNEGVVFKIVENRLKQERKLIVHSLNPAYTSYEIPAEEIKEIWRFRHYISPELPEPGIPSSQIIQRITQLQKEIARLKGSE